MLAIININEYPESHGQRYPEKGLDQRLFHGNDRSLFTQEAKIENERKDQRSTKNEICKL